MKLKIFAVAAGLTSLVACGPTYQATDETLTVEVPTTIQSSFTADYPNAVNVVWLRYDQVPAPIDWELSGWTVLDANDYVVRYDMDGSNYYTYYDSDGNLIGTAYVITDYKLLPAAVSSTISTQYSGYSITSVHKEMQKDRLAYEVQLETSTTKVKALIDANGNVIKAKTRDK